MINREFKENSVIKHFKGKEYIFICKAFHSETGETFAVYRATYGDKRTYVRPYDMFISKVDKNKYPDCKQEYRFEVVEV